MIGVCGFVNSGSSAVCDLLKEFDDAAVIDDIELSLAITPDGLEDLEFHLMAGVSKYMSSNVAIERFRRMVRLLYEGSIDRLSSPGFTRGATDAYLDAIVQLRWNGYGMMDKVLYPGRLRAYLLRKYLRFSRRTDGRYFREDRRNPFERTMEFSIRPENFYDASRAYLRTIIDGLCAGGRGNVAVVNQAFAANDPAKSFRFFDDPRAIIVDRDPRDAYVLAKKYQLYRGRKMPTGSVDDFITYHRRMREGMPYADPDERVLRVRFEDLVYDYDAAVARIAAFSGLKDHARRRSLFVPEMSAANCQVFRRHPELGPEIARIERQLPDWLYPFEAHPPVAASGDPFLGRSPYNRNKRP